MVCTVVQVYKLQIHAGLGLFQFSISEVVEQHFGNGVHPGLAQGLAALEAPLFISDSVQTTVDSNLAFI